MRKTWIAAWAAAGMATGCAGTAGPSFNGGMAANGAPGQPAVQQASWTDKITAPFTKNPFAGMMGDGKPKQPAAPPTDFPFDPDKATPELYVAMAQLSHRNGNVEQARQHYQKALSIDPANLDALLGAARMEDREARLDVALMLYQRAAAAHPQNATALNDLALCHARRGDLPTAQQILEQAVRIEPRKALYRNNVAKVLVEMNQLQPAMANLAAVHTSAVANYNMGVMLNERGRGGEASQYLAQALAIDPNMEPARALLSQMTAPGVDGVVVAERSILQNLPTMPMASPVSNDSILPTPEVVASMPWTPSMAVDSAPQPTLPPVQSEQMPMLLPPVN